MPIMPPTEDEAYDLWRDMNEEDHARMFANPVLAAELREIEESMCESLSRISEALLEIKRINHKEYKP